MPNLRPASPAVVIIRQWLLIIALSFTPAVFAANTDEVSAAKLTVAIAECPPFVIIENGRRSGLAVYLWERIGSEMGVSWDYVEYPLGSLLETIHSKENSNP
jgi:hypothetical protein